LAAPFRAALADAAAEPAIPPGQADLMLDMLGRGSELPGDCKLQGVGVEYTIAKAIYDCSLGEVVVELSYPTAAEPAEVETDRFALAVLDGSPPEGLLDAVRAVVAEHEADFVWVNPAGRPAEGPRDEDVAVP
jgi:hypothetical protein